MYDVFPALAAHRNGQTVERSLPLEALYTGYRQNVMASDEVLSWTVVPRPQAGEWLGAYKVSKRTEDDISAICLVVQLHLQSQGQTAPRIQQTRIGAGGVAATPVRARRTEAALHGQAWTVDTVQRAQTTLQAEFQPISDLRASGDYRRHVREVGRAS